MINKNPAEKLKRLRNYEEWKRDFKKSTSIEWTEEEIHDYWTFEVGCAEE